MMYETVIVGHSGELVRGCIGFYRDLETTACLILHPNFAELCHKYKVVHVRCEKFRKDRYGNVEREKKIYFKLDENRLKDDKYMERFRRHMNPARISGVGETYREHWTMFRITYKETKEQRRSELTLLLEKVNARIADYDNLPYKSDSLVDLKIAQGQLKEKLRLLEL